MRALARYASADGHYEEHDKEHTMSGALDNYKQMPIGTTIGTSYAKVLDAPVGVNAHDLVVTNLDFSATVTIALTSAPGDASTVPQVEVPAGTSRTIRNVPSQAGADV